MSKRVKTKEEQLLLRCGSCGKTNLRELSRCDLCECHMCDTCFSSDPNTDWPRCASCHDGICKKCKPYCIQCKTCSRWYCNGQDCGQYASALRCSVCRTEHCIACVDRYYKNLQCTDCKVDVYVLFASDTVAVVPYHGVPLKTVEWWKAHSKGGDSGGGGGGGSSDKRRSKQDERLVDWLYKYSREKQPFLKPEEHVVQMFIFE